MLSLDFKIIDSIIRFFYSDNINKSIKDLSYCHKSYIGTVRPKFNPQIVLFYGAWPAEGRFVQQKVMFKNKKVSGGVSRRPLCVM